MSDFLCLRDGFSPNNPSRRSHNGQPMKISDGSAPPAEVLKPAVGTNHRDSKVQIKRDADVPVRRWT
jgi:hypothetical protein